MLEKKEKRNFFRLNAYHLVKYRLASQEEWQMAIASIGDISAGGVRLRSDKELPRGIMLQVRINFPKVPLPVSVLAKVVWVKKLGKASRFEIGLEFIEIEDLLRQEINQRVDYVRRKSE